MGVRQIVALAIASALFVLGACGPSLPHVVSVAPTRCAPTELRPRELSASPHWAHAEVLEFGHARIRTPDGAGEWAYAVLAVRRWYPIAPRVVEANPDRLMVATQTSGTDASGGHGHAPRRGEMAVLCGAVGREIAVAVPDATAGSGDGAPTPQAQLAARFDASPVELGDVAPPSVLPPPRR